MAIDPEELVNLASNADKQSKLNSLHKDLLAICDPISFNTQAQADQAAMIQRYSGRTRAHKLGAPATTPPPSVGKYRCHLFIRCANSSARWVGLIYNFIMP